MKNPEIIPPNHSSYRSALRKVWVAVMPFSHCGLSAT